MDERIIICIIVLTCLLTNFINFLLFYFWFKKIINKNYQFLFKNTLSYNSSSLVDVCISSV